MAEVRRRVVVFFLGFASGEIEVDASTVVTASSTSAFFALEVLRRLLAVGFASKELDSAALFGWATATSEPKSSSVLFLRDVRRVRLGFCLR